MSRWCNNLHFCVGYLARNRPLSRYLRGRIFDGGAARQSMEKARFDHADPRRLVFCFLPDKHLGTTKHTRYLVNFKSNKKKQHGFRSDWFQQVLQIQRETHILISVIIDWKQTNNRERRRRIYRKIPGNLKGRVKETTPGVTWMWKQWKTHTKMAAYKFCVLLGRDVSERAEWNHATWIRFSLSRSPFFLSFFCTWRRLPTPGPQVRNLQLFSTAMNWTQPLSHVRSVAHTRVPVFLSLFQCDSGANRLENATTSEKIPCGRSEIITQQQSRG